MRRAFILLVALLAALTVPAVHAEDTPAPDAGETQPIEKPEEPGDVVEEPMVEPDEPIPGEEGLDEAIEEYTEVTRLEETVVTPFRGPRLAFEQPRQVVVITNEDIQQQQPRHPIQTMSLRDPGVVMDIRTATTGDPIMRGFAGFNLLALVDGNSLSTLWGEGGFGADDMYGKVDPETIQRIEIVHGPNSVLYGSSALGGVVNFITRQSPIDYTGGGMRGGGRVKTVLMSNSSGYRVRGELFGASSEVKGMLGVTYTALRDGKSGEKTLDPTGGDEFNFDIRTDWMMAPGNELTVSILRVFREPTYRYYRPTQDNTNERIGVNVAWSADELAGFMSDFEWRVYYQYKQDERRFYDTGREGYARTDTWSTDAQANTDVGAGNFLTYGLHAHVDFGESADDEQFTYTKPPPTRADAPDTEWWNLAAYVQDEWEIIDDTLTLTASARYDYFIFESKETSTYRPAGGDRDADFFTDSIGALTGGIAVSWAVAPEWRVLGSWSRGFRQYAPNFGFRQLGNGVLIPNQLLDPVTSMNYELGFRTRYPVVNFECFGYYSDIDDWQALRPDTYNGSDWYDFNENGKRDANEDVISQQPVEGAYVYGIEAKGTLFLDEMWGEIPDGWSLWGGFAYSYGKVDDGEYFRHTMPARGLLGLRWDDPDPKRGAFVEFIAEMVAKYDRIPSDRKQNDLAYRREPQDGSASPLLRSYGGVPGYTVFYLYTGINVTEQAKVTLGIENLTDKKFRRAHSRMDAFGIDVVFGMEVSF